MDARLNSWWLGLLSLLVALMPLSFSVSWHVKVLPVLLLLIAGLYLLFRNPATRNDYRKAWLVMAACGFDVLYTALNILGHGLGWDAFDLPSHILLYMATAAVFSLPLRMRWVWLGFSLTAIVLGIVCIVQHFFLRIDRAFGLNGGDWGAIEFAMVLLVLSLNGWLQVFYSSGHPFEKILHGAGGVFGLYGALLTQSRGPLLAFVPILLLLIIIYAWHSRRWSKSLLMFIAIISGGVLAASSVHNVNTPAAVEASDQVTVNANLAPLPVKAAGATSSTTTSGNSQPVFVKRFADVGSEMTSYNTKTDAKGAVRERMEMWRTAIHAFRDHPLAGVGIDQFGAYARQQIVTGSANSAIAKYDHPHNEYLEAAATGGIPGLLVIGLILVVPLGYFLRHALHAHDSEMIAACVGIAVVSMYALCGLTDNVFYRAMPHSLYFFLVLGLAVLLGRQKSSEEAALRV